MKFMMKKAPREALTRQAAQSRSDAQARRVALYGVALYNLIGVADIFITQYGVTRGLAEEANPVMRTAMDHFGMGWIAGKLALQAVISTMVLWFPHRIVLALFGLAVAINAAVVYSNLRIVFG